MCFWSIVFLTSVGARWPILSLWGPLPLASHTALTLADSASFHAFCCGEYSGFVLYISCPRPGISHLSQKPDSFGGKWFLEITFWTCNGILCERRRTKLYNNKQYIGKKTRETSLGHLRYRGWWWLPAHEEVWIYFLEMKKKDAHINILIFSITLNKIRYLKTPNNNNVFWRSWALISWAAAIWSLWCSDTLWWF